MWPRWDGETESQVQRYPILGMVLALAVTRAHLRPAVAGDAHAVPAGVVPVEG